MSDFDTFISDLFNEAKFLFELSKAQNEKKKVALLHASIAMGMSFIESYINAISDELTIRNEFSLLEKSLLQEKDVVFLAGNFKLTNDLKMYRLIDRIEFLFCKFAKREIDKSDKWFSNIKSSINIRNKLLHPKEVNHINEKIAGMILEAVLEAANTICVTIYKKQLPYYQRGLQSTL